MTQQAKNIMENMELLISSYCHYYDNCEEVVKAMLRVNVKYELNLKVDYIVNRVSDVWMVYKHGC